MHITSRTIVLFVSLLAFLIFSAPTVTAVAESAPPTQEEIQQAEQQAQTWRHFCSELGHYARVQAHLRDQGVRFTEKIPHLIKSENDLMNVTLEQVRTFTYQSTSLPPVAIGAEVEVTCLEAREL